VNRPLSQDAITREGFRHEHFLEACMASAALVTLADQRIRPGEVAGLSALLDDMARVRAVDTRQAFALFERYADALEHDHAAGKREVFAAVARLAGDRQAASLLVHAAVEIGKADRLFSASEYSVIRELGEVLGLDLAELE
jgi:tellurite resistance protein TerB